MLHVSASVMHKYKYRYRYRFENVDMIQIPKIQDKDYMIFVRVFITNDKHLVL